jgi:hypothetical protein
MSQYLSELLTREISDKISELHEPIIYESDKFGLIEVPRGFQTDFASVPRIPIIYPLYGDRAHKSAVLHDWGYRTDAVPSLTFMQVNDLFFEAMECVGHPCYVRYPMYWGVILGGWWSYHRRKVMDKL